MAGVASILVYYVSVLVLNSSPVAGVFQPQLNQLFLQLLSIGKVWIVIVVTPLVALLPDFIQVTWRSSYRKSPVDVLISRQDSLRRDSSQRYLV